MRPSVIRDQRDPALVRVERELARLEALAAKRRYRIAVLRALRGSVGAGGTFAAILKLKLAGSLAAKVALAVVVGLGFAWPTIALAIVVVGVVILSIASCEPVACDCPCECDRKEKRRKRLDEMIAERKARLS